MKKIIILIIACVLSGVVMIYPLHGKNDEPAIKPGSWLRNITIPIDKEGTESTTMQIYFPSNYKKGGGTRTIILLHAYNGSIIDWENNSSVTHYANVYNFALVCPHMKSTVYETRFYPETQIKWGPVPGCEFIGKTLIKYLQKHFSLAESRSSTGIAGIANGGRGALLAAATYDETFGAAVGLSGDYDPLSMTGEKRLTSVYGDPKAFASRWENDDNILKMADKLQKTAVFLAHGGKDGYVPSGQTLILAVRIQQLKKKKGGFDLTYVEKKYGSHDWRFWQSMTSDVMAFFNTKLK